MPVGPGFAASFFNTTLQKISRTVFVSSSSGRRRYANGVAVARDEKSVLVVETNQNRVHRVDLATGISEIFVDKLPAVPDGVTRAPDGGFWIAGVVPLSPLPRLLAPYYRRADLPKTDRGDAAAATRIFRGDEFRRRRG